MSTVAARPASLSTPRTDSAIPLRRGALVAIAVGGLLAAVGGGLLVGTSDHLIDPVAYGIQLALMLVGTVAAALYWLVRRPGNRLGWALLALAGATGVLTLNGASSPLLHTIGVAVEPVFFLLSYYAVFAFPDGRLRGLSEKALLAAMALYFLTGFVPYLLFSPVVTGGAPLGGCGAECPENAFMIADRPTIAASYGSDGSYAVIVIMLATLACLVYRLATATRPRRRALIPVYLPALTLTLPILVFHGIITELLSPDPDVISNAGWFVTVSRVVLPYGFLLAVVQSAFFAAAALKMIVRRMNESPTGPQLRATMADALDDSSLEIAFAVDHADGFVDANGDPIDPTPTAGRTATPVTQNGDTVAVVVHDDALNTDPELVDVAGNALLLAVENDRLQRELRLTNAELRATRARIVSAGDSERRKIERDLHDGAQQHLVALRIRVGLASELADPVMARRLADVGTELEEILDELRDLAQGLYPPLLREFGLHDALVSVARRSAPPARVEDAGIGRYSEDTEAAVYFCCVESLQNVGKHAGVGAHAVVRLWQDVGRLCFEIEDDGAGCDVESVSRSGAGYTNMTDRIAAVGGKLAVESRLGEGTKVHGSIPADDPPPYERPVSAAATSVALTTETA